MTTNNKIYLTAAELAEMLDISFSTQFSIHFLNKFIRMPSGYIVVAGKVPVKYFEERYFGFSA